MRDILFRRSFDRGLTTYLGEDDAYLALAKVHKDICGAHQGGDKMKWTLNRQRVYWLTMI